MRRPPDNPLNPPSRRAAPCLLALLVALMTVLWAPAALADEPAPGMDPDTFNGGMDGGDEPKEETSMQGTSEEEDSEGGLVSGIAEDVFNTITNNIVEKTADAAAGWAEDFLTDGAFSLPAPEGEIKTFYDQVSGVVQPGAIALLLLTGLMLTLRGANYNTSYATQNALPKIVFFFAALAFFPEVMGMISDVTRNLADALVDPSQLSDAYVRLVEAQVKNGGLLGGLIVLIAAVMLLFLFAISIFKSFLFGVLFIAGPLAMFVYPIPTLSGLTAQWFKGTVACSAIPLLWAIEASIGSALISAPEMMFGEGYSNNFIVPVLVLVLSWVMIKTPFKVFEWCFYGYSAGSGLVSHVARAGATRFATGAFGR
ncbi:hypothetical protein GBA63_21680 (plasmid) [Rubrobacter tropicus]|uniref:TrbL/VirB6 plasmid conjugal transfer protein n=1 Tax=Rubrobacter tropicus TaxID=2653851 RepID=A0A6G8QFU4_9ACTN|nr:hypothetical protein [Rubrobacter tropicus]QIN85332.1 hypothetical protein GBA63_21680 [Rubrobacter tropicus]